MTVRRSIVERARPSSRVTRTVEPGSSAFRRACNCVGRMRLAGSLYEKQEKATLPKLIFASSRPSQPRHPTKLWRPRLMQPADPKFRSMRDSSLHYVFSYFVHFDVVLWRLISALQAFSQCILIASMYRTRSAIDLEDKAIMREAALLRDAIFHETPHHHAPRHACSESVPLRSRV
jgi:hypothetical protein